MLPEIIVDETANLVERLAARVEAEGAEALRRRGRFTLALPGGSVARTFFPRLARGRFDWSRALFFWGDERAVPTGDDASNYGLARALWLDPARVPVERIYRMKADSVDLDEAAAEYSATLEHELGRPPALDLALLGVGADGHVCSLFPGRPLLAEKTRWTAFERAAPSPPARRLTLTLPVLEAAGLLVVAAMGPSKAEAVGAVLGRAAPHLPLAMALERAGRAVVFLDPAAAARVAAR